MYTAQQLQAPTGCTCQHVTYGEYSELSQRHRTTPCTQPATVKLPTTGGHELYCRTHALEILRNDKRIAGNRQAGFGRGVQSGSGMCGTAQSVARDDSKTIDELLRILEGNAHLFR